MESLPLPERQSGPEKARAVLEEFIQNPALDMLAAAWDRTDLPGDSAERLRIMHDIAALPHPSWDFREGKERRDVEWDEPVLKKLLRQPSVLGKTHAEVIMDAGRQLRLLDRHDEDEALVDSRRPTYLVIPGAIGTDPRDRLIAGLWCVGDFKGLIYLGSERVIRPDERPAADAYAPGAKTEFGLGVGAFEFALKRPVWRDELKHNLGTNADKRILQLEHYNFEFNGQTKEGLVVSTPAQPARPRANTYDNFETLKAVIDIEKNPNTSILIATSALYAWQQLLPAVEKFTLPYGAKVEVVGHNDENVKPLQVLQEIKASIDAAMHLYEAIELHSITH